jgi:predicted NAD/FAD-dependent oxidoreductase
LKNGAVAEPLSVAVVGAGLSGLACAVTLQQQGHKVRVFDKGRGVGGRMATRWTNGWNFDHGAQYFTVRDPRFARAVESWRQDSLVAAWHGEIVVLDGGEIEASQGATERFVGVPSMSAICRHLAAGVEVSLETQVGALELGDDPCDLVSVEGVGLGRYDAVVVSAPSPQAADLLRRAAPAMAARAAEAQMAPCWAAMVSLDVPLGVGFDGAFVQGSPLSWVARNTSKPGRLGGEAWVLHASPDWSQANLELEQPAVAQLLFEAFRDALGGFDPVAAHLDAHRWRFALPTEPLPESCLFDARLRLAACGDWCGGPRVEGAFLSGCAAADCMMRLRPIKEV